MTIKYNISEQDYVNFNIDHFNSSKKMKPFMLLLKFMPIVLFFIRFFTIDKFTLSTVNIIVACVFSSIWIGFFSKIIQTSLRITTIAYIKNGKANDFIGEQVLKLTDDYMEESNLSMLSQIRYSSIERITSGHGLFYIYIGAVKAIIVPAAAFSDIEQENAFFNILSQKTGLDFIR